MVHGKRRPTRFGNRHDAARVGKHDQSRSRAQQPRSVVQCHRQAGIVRRRPRVPAHQCVEYAQGAARAGRRGHRRFLAAAPQDRDPVAIAYRRPHRHRRRARGLHRLVANAGSEIQGWRSIRYDQGQPLAFGLEQLRMRATAACGEAPVDMAHVVARHVFARLRVFHAATTGAGLRGTSDVVPTLARRRPALRGGAQGHKFGQRGLDSIAGGRIHRYALRYRAQGSGTTSSRAATSLSPSQPSAVAS